MRNNKNKGFTLVELLVVIAILAILATVSVVGYTSFIESATVSNDENIAAQLNNFLVAMKADSNGKYYDDFTSNDGKVTEDNVWEITQYILKDGGLESLEPQALKYGYNYYYNLNTQKFEVIKEKDVTAPGLVALIRAFANGETLKPGFFKTKTGDVVFLVDTKGSSLAEAVRGFYTFDFLAEEENAWTKFQEIVADAAAEGHTNISTALENSVFVTEDGTYANGNSATNYVFHTEKNIIMEPSVPVTLSNPVMIPANVTSFEVGAFNVTYTEDGKLVFEVPVETLKSALCEDSLPNGLVVNIDGNDWTYHSATNDDDAKLTYSTETVYLDIANPLKDFDMLLSGTANKLHNVADDSVGYDAIIVWDGATFTLGLDSSSLVPEFSDKSLSSKRVSWALTDADGETATYAGVSVSAEGTITLSVDDTTKLYPETTEFYVTATAAHPMTNGKYAQGTFKIVLSRPTNAIFSVDGTATAGNTTANITYAETVDGIKDTFSVSSAFTAGTNTCEKYFDGATYTTDFSIVSVDTDVAEISGTSVKILSSLFDGNDSGDPVATTIKVRIGSYFEHEITLNVDNTKYMFSLVNNGNINTLGTEGHAIKPSDLFTTTETFADADVVKVQAFLKPSRYATIKELIDNAANHLPTQENPQGVWANAQSIDFAGTANFDFDLKDPTKPAQVVFVVTVNGVRASEDYEVDIVNAYNIRDFAEIKTISEPTVVTGTASSETKWQIEVISRPNRSTSTVRITQNNDGTQTMVITQNDYKYESVSYGTKVKITTTPKTYTYTISGYFGNNLVLLGDIAMGATYNNIAADNNPSEKGQYNTLDIPYGTTFYGNGYTFELTNGRLTQEGIINLKGKIQDTKVIGNFYTDFAERVSYNSGSSAICAKDGKSVIENCYIAYTRSPLRLSSDCTVKDSVFYGGRYSNIDITGGKLTVQGEVITVNQPIEYEKDKWSVGLGVSVWYSANATTTKVEVEENATFKQYNFIPSNRTDAMPTLMSAVSLGSMYSELINDDDYAPFVFEKDGVEYMNTGITYINKDTAAVGENVTLDQDHIYNYVGTQYDLAFDDITWGILNTAVEDILGKDNPFSNPTPFFVKTLNHTEKINEEDVVVENNQKFFEESANAVTKYAPDAYKLTTK